ncbi:MULTISPECIES: hypothetical protein [unclassified Calothrix]|nr:MULTISPECIES: hypothetical protein [unclassified Calothrix]
MGAFRLLKCRPFLTPSPPTLEIECSKTFLAEIKDTANGEAL